MRNNLGYYHSIENFATMDGPGIRNVLFLSGCRLQCSFCHNPDTWTRSAKTISVKQVLDQYHRYRAFYDKSGGGITVSGGEPLLQANFVAELFYECRKQGIHTVLDTAGYVQATAIEKVLPFTDQVLFCVKAVDPIKHRRLTAASDNRIILQNLTKAAGAVPTVVRYVLIPGLTDTVRDLEDLARLVCSLPRQAQVELLPYHCLGRAKWDQLGKVYPLKNVPQAERCHLETAKGQLLEHKVACFY